MLDSHVVPRLVFSEACSQPLAGPIVEVKLVVLDLSELVPTVQQGFHTGRTEDRQAARVAQRGSDMEILTLAILSQWPRFRSERDF